MKLVIATYGTEGDTRPLAALGRALIDAGHDVRLLADAATLGSAVALGVPSASLSGDIRGAIAPDGALADAVRGAAASTTRRRRSRRSPMRTRLRGCAKSPMHRKAVTRSSCRSRIVRRLVGRRVSRRAGDRHGHDSDHAHCGIRVAVPAAGEGAALAEPRKPPVRERTAVAGVQEGDECGTRERVRVAAAQACVDRSSDAVRRVAGAAVRPGRLAVECAGMRPVADRCAGMGAIVRTLCISRSGRSPRVHRFWQYGRLRSHRDGRSADARARRSPCIVLSGLERYRRVDAAEERSRDRRYAA